MASFDSVNYSLRPSKGLQRGIVFAGLAALLRVPPVQQPVYVGFGSVWFTDFVLAHRILLINDMISMEANEIGFKRATFNRPYSTVSVEPGLSGDVLPKLLGNPVVCSRPWIVWLDYDAAFSETSAADVRLLIARAPEDSVLIITVNADHRRYGSLKQRAKRLRDFLGDSVPADLEKERLEEEALPETLAELVLAAMGDLAINYGRPGGFVPAFSIVYKDSSSMVTVGGALPSAARREEVRAVVRHRDWTCRPARRIVAPHLTIRETLALQSLLPRSSPLSRVEVRALGFDLEDDQLEIFQQYYRDFPTFSQIIT